jgi:hypothetical protein
MGVVISRKSAGSATGPRLVLAAYLAVSVAPFAVAATPHAFWERKHDMAPVATALFAGLLVALVLHHRWAWMLLAAFEAAIVLSYAFGVPSPLGCLLNIVGFALLVSAPMRRYVFDRRTTARRTR